MASRKKIGLLFRFDENWAGGLYYLYNIINSLRLLPKNQQPDICIFYYNKSTVESIKNLQYPRLKILPIFKPTTPSERIINKIIRLVTRKPYNPASIYSKRTVDFLFPCISGEDEKIVSTSLLRKIYWIPDLQYKFLPDFFSNEEIEKRDIDTRTIASLSSTLVLSSQNVKENFIDFFPSHNVKIFVLPFAAVLPPYKHIHIQTLRLKYLIDQEIYFMAPNQFWAHKNHLVILKAVKVILQKGFDIIVAFTGKEYDHRNPDYFAQLMEFATINNLMSHVRFLGFIDRAEQLKLMKEARAVIQPSFFEGWSTIIEDTKAINNALILSDIKVHREQCGALAMYFDPTNENDLADCMIKHITHVPAQPFVNYERDIMNFAEKILSL